MCREQHDRTPSVIEKTLAAKYATTQDASVPKIL
jgi:hypothetical protein